MLPPYHGTMTPISLFYRWRCWLTCPGPLSVSVLKFTPRPQFLNAWEGAHFTRTFPGQFFPLWNQQKSPNMCVYLHAHIHACTHAIHMHAPIHTCAPTHRHTLMYTHTHTHTLSFFMVVKESGCFNSSAPPPSLVICLLWYLLVD